MHDGHLFTIGICGAAAGGPAVALLNSLLTALPPVKRAALLGEVGALDAQGRLNDPLAEPLLADIADAELIIIVTPLIFGSLPPRLEHILHRLDQPASGQSLSGKVCRYISIGEGSDRGATRLSRLCGNRGTDFTALAFPPCDQLDPAQCEAAVAVVRRAYALARSRMPDVLPTNW